MTTTIDLPMEIVETLARQAAQKEQDIAGYVRQLAVTASEMQASARKTAAPRVPGLHAGAYWIADDFDAPLPDSFWLGEENSTRKDGDYSA